MGRNVRARECSYVLPLNASGCSQRFGALNMRRRNPFHLHETTSRWGAFKRPATRQFASVRGVPRGAFELCISCSDPGCSGRLAAGRRGRTLSSRAGREETCSMFYKASDLSQATYAAKSALYFWHNRCVLPLAGLAVLDGAASPVFLKRKELLFPLALSSANPQDPRDDLGPG